MNQAIPTQKKIHATKLTALTGKATVAETAVWFMMKTEQKRVITMVGILISIGVFMLIMAGVILWVTYRLACHQVSDNNKS
jgi:hypothetical protein